MPVIESHSLEKVPQEQRKEIAKRKAPNRRSTILSVRWRARIESRPGDSKGSSPDFGAFKPLDGFALIGDNLRLPDQTDRHYAHHDQAENDHEALLRFRRGDVQGANDPRHGLGLLVLGRYARDPTRNAGRRGTRVYLL